jgi:hypothetical protein
MSVDRALLAVVLLATLTTVGADIPLNSDVSVLVLRNGYVLRGQVVPLGDYYLVVQSDADQIRIPVTRVEMVCRSLEEAYRRKRDVVISGDVRSHLHLASWSIRHRLHARAADQILAAYALDPGNPRIASLKNQLRSATQPAEPEQTPQIAESNPVVPPIPQLPRTSIRQFTTNIQPLLLNRCATGACHGTGAVSDFQLIRPPVGQLITSRLTQRNLWAVLNYVQNRSPLDSPLLTIPQQPHGGLDEPVLNASDLAQNEVIVNWIRDLPGNNRVKPASALIREPNTLLQRVSENSMPESTEPIDSEESEPKDPFDPDVFNNPSL